MTVSANQISREWDIWPEVFNHAGYIDVRIKTNYLEILDPEATLTTNMVQPTYRLYTKASWITLQSMAN